MIEKLKFGALAIAAICLIGAALYGLYYFNRWVNYSLSYEDLVQETICEMVKPEALARPEACEVGQ